MLDLIISIETWQEEFELLPEQFLTPTKYEIRFENQFELWIKVLVVEIIKKHDEKLLTFLGFENFIEYLFELNFLPFVLKEVLG